MQQGIVAVVYVEVEVHLQAIHVDKLNDVAVVDRLEHLQLQPGKLCREVTEVFLAQH